MKFTWGILVLYLLLEIVQCGSPLRPDACAGLGDNCKTGDEQEKFNVEWNTRKQLKIKSVPKPIKRKAKHVLWGSGKTVKYQANTTITVSRKDGRFFTANCSCIEVTPEVISVRHIGNIIRPFYINVACPSAYCRICLLWERFFRFSKLKLWVITKPGAKSWMGRQLYASTCIDKVD